MIDLVSDTTLSSGGIGVRSNCKIYMDYWRIDNSDTAWTTQTATLSTAREGGDPWYDGSQIVVAGGATADSGSAHGGDNVEFYKFAL